MIDITVKAPWHSWVVGVIAVLFNAIGVFDFVMCMTQGSSYLASAGMTRPDRPLRGDADVDDRRMGHRCVRRHAGFGAFAAAKQAGPSGIAASLAAFLASLLYTHVLTDGGDAMGGQMAGASVVITVLLVFLAWYSRAMARRGVLRWYSARRTPANAGGWWAVKDSNLRPKD